MCQWVGWAGVAFNREDRVFIILVIRGCSEFAWSMIKLWSLMVTWGGSAAGVLTCPIVRSVLHACQVLQMILHAVPLVPRQEAVEADEDECEEDKNNHTNFSHFDEVARDIINDQGIELITERVSIWGTGRPSSWNEMLAKVSLMSFFKSSKGVSILVKIKD